MLEKVKTALRQKSTTFDETEISPLIEACLSDLNRVGVLNVTEKVAADDPLVTHAVIMYCKAYFGKSADAERYRLCYEMARDGMAMMGE